MADKAFSPPAFGFNEVDQLLSYDPTTGVLIWKRRPMSMFRSLHEHNRWNNRYAGQAAGNLHWRGYRHVGMFGSLHSAHRLAWLLHHGRWPEGEIDHINGARDDNRLENLRDVDKVANQQNAQRRSDNRSGTVGVVRYRRDGRWVARINVRGRRKHLGYFDTLEDAVAARKAAERQYGFHENHGRAA